VWVPGYGQHFNSKLLVEKKTLGLPFDFILPYQIQQGLKKDQFVGIGGPIK
jgi:hypothetical protein